MRVPVLGMQSGRPRTGPSGRPRTGLWLAGALLVLAAGNAPEVGARSGVSSGEGSGGIVQPSTAGGGRPLVDALPAPAGVTVGNAASGRAIVVDRQRGLCLLCHSGPFPEVPQQGNLAPSLAGAGTRWSEAQLRLRITDGRRLHPDSIMPAYGIVDPAPRVAMRHQGQAILTPQQIEDVVAFLSTLRD